MDVKNPSFSAFKKCYQLVNLRRTSYVGLHTALLLTNLYTHCISVHVNKTNKFQNFTYIAYYLLHTAHKCVLSTCGEQVKLQKTPLAKCMLHL